MPLMLFVIGVLVTLAATVRVWSRVRAGRISAAALGWMSEQWLAEQRASRRP